MNTDQKAQQYLRSVVKGSCCLTKKTEQAIIAAYTAGAEQQQEQSRKESERTIATACDILHETGYFTDEEGHSPEVLEQQFRDTLNERLLEADTDMWTAADFRDEFRRLAKDSNPDIETTYRMWHCMHRLISLTLARLSNDDPKTYVQPGDAITPPHIILPIDHSDMEDDDPLYPLISISEFPDGTIWFYFRTCDIQDECLETNQMTAIVEYLSNLL